MEHPVAAVVMNNLPHLLDNPDLVQSLLDDARADLKANDIFLAVAAAHLRVCLAFEAELRSFPDATDGEKAECAAHIAGLAASCVFFRKRRWMLGHLIGSLLAVRALAYARSRAHLVPCVLLAAVSAAVVVRVSTGGRGGVVPGLRSFVRFAIVVLYFLFSSNRPRNGGG